MPYQKREEFILCKLCEEPMRRASRTYRFCAKCLPNKSARSRASRYGLSHPQFLEMLAKQENTCALCPSTLHQDHINGLHVDHDHKTGKIRGLLCGKCNHAVGRIELFLERITLDRVFQYLKVTDENH